MAEFFVFAVFFVSGVIYSWLRVALTLALKEEAPELWHTLGEPLGPRENSPRFRSWLFARRYEAEEAIPDYLKASFGTLRIVMLIILASMVGFLCLLIASMFEPKIETHWGQSAPIPAAVGR